MGFHARAEWADRHTNMPAASRGVEAAVVHHTVGAYTGGDKAAWLRKLEHNVTDNVAPGNSSPLIAIDYNEMIFPDGDVWEGRGLAHEDGATYKFNARSASWALIGNYDTTQLPDAAAAALAQRIQVAVQQGWLRKNPIIEGHRDVGTFPTACPGRYTEQRLGEVRLHVAGLVAVPTAPAPEDDMAQADYFITTTGTSTWWFYNGNTKRPLRTGEAQQLVDLGIVRRPEVKGIDPGQLNAIPDFAA